MINEDRTVLDEVRRIVQETLRGCPVTIYLFGSWARGRASRLSDIDLGIDAKVPLPLGMLGLLRDRLEESHVPYRVDVVDLAAVDSKFREGVIHSGVRWND